MIRSVLGLFIFAVALCAYIVVRPGSDPQFDTRAPVTMGNEVTRAATETLLPGTPLPIEVEDTPVVAAPAPAPAPRPADLIQTDNSTIIETSANVLAGLGLDVELPDVDPNDPLAAMSTDILQEIQATTGREIPVRKAAPASALENLVVAALKEGRPDAEIDALINTAAVSGQVTVPEILVTSDGRVDTAVLLQAIITQANISAGAAAPAVPDTPTGDGTGVEVRVVQRATETEQYRFYTVNRGDSLGAIAIKFYGNVDKYPVIFQANRNILSSPDQIMVGQRLAIPDLSDQI